MGGAEAQRHDPDVGEDKNRDHGQQEQDRTAESPGACHLRLTLLNAPRVALLLVPQPLLELRRPVV